MSMESERLKAAEARVRELEVQLRTVRVEAERRSTAEVEMRARAAQRAGQARGEAAAARIALALRTELDLSWIRPGIARRTIEIANWIVIRRLTEKLRQRSVDTARGRLRAAAYYLIKGPPKPAFPSQEALSLALPARPRRTGIKTVRVRVAYISGEPNSPGHVYRVLRYLDAAGAIGGEASWMRPDEVLHRAGEITEADLLVVWRAAWDSEIAFAVELARRSKTKVVFDIDDLLVDPNLARTEVIAGIARSGISEEQYRRQCNLWQMTLKAADYCTVPTEELAQHVRRLGIATLVLPNGFDHKNYRLSRRLARQKRSEPRDGLVRIGYAGGSVTHERDFAVAAEAIARVLRDRSQCRLVLFCFSDPNKTRILAIERYPGFEGLEGQIEWREIVPLARLPEELTRFDINLAPLEVGNVFCEAKSELKFFEAALVDVPTVASPTGPFRRTMNDGVTGFLASSTDEWYDKILQLVDDPALRHRLSRAAHHEVMRHFGPVRRAELLDSALSKLLGDGQAAARAALLETRRGPVQRDILTSDSKISFESDRFGEADITVILRLSGENPPIQESLDSVYSQTVQVLDLVLIEDLTTTSGSSVAMDWIRRSTSRFNRLVVLQSHASIGSSLNAAIDAADTPFILLLPVNQTLSEACVSECLATICDTRADVAYPRIERFVDSFTNTPIIPFDLVRITSDRDYVDAPLLISKEAWAIVGGYSDHPARSEGYDFWRRLVEFGFGGRVAGGEALARFANSAARSNSPSTKR
jgi:O-antigen biosynthesis protein